LAKLETRTCPACGKQKTFRADCKSCGCRGTNPFAAVVSGPEVNATEVELQKLRNRRLGKDDEIKMLRERVVALEAENDVFLTLKNSAPKIIDIQPKVSSGKSESAMNFVWSDWHLEERVYPEQVSGKNEYNLAKFQERFLRLLHGDMAWYKIASRDTTIKTIVVSLLGDFITGSIHEDLAEANQLAPADAVHKAYSTIVNGFKFLLENTKDVTFVIPCHSGNHGRMTKDQRYATEAGNSLEYFMYLMLQDYFQDEKRLEFIVQPGYHSYVRYFEGAFEARYHHGHQINYQGGVGGITIPVNKAIAQWNKARPVNLDVFGHFHTRFDGGNFVANGSVIGYNAYSVSIKASYEKPSQQTFLINREYGEKTMVAPVFLE
jgi:hypothetical protein